VTTSAIVPRGSPVASAPASATEASVAVAPLPDSKLAGAIEGAIARDPVLHSQTIRVSVVNGEVALEGSVLTLAAKRRVENLVGSLKGVRSLINGILVDTPTPTRPDADVAKDVTVAIKRDPATRKANVRVTVSAGTVTLRGTADSATQRELLAEGASRVRGVEVVNLELASLASPRGDAELSTDVTDRLRDDARLDGSQVSVVVHGRSAALSGVVGSLAQRDAAVEDARGPGIAGVDVHALRVDWMENERARKDAQNPLPSDSHITDAVRSQLLGDARVEVQLPAVRVEEGVVTLSGNVMDFRAKTAAARDAYGVRGVSRVEDLMTVAPAMRETDATIERQVQQSIYSEATAPDARKVQVATANAKVTLRGAVASPEEKDTLEDDAEEVPGVIAVENDLEVKGYGPETHVAPAGSIRERVDENIFWDPRVEGDKIAADVAPNGDVTLTGLVYSAEEARSASQDAIKAGGAHVINRIRVAS
jgi:osmotically-inducible protein OsmY